MRIGCNETVKTRVGIVVWDRQGWVKLNISSKLTFFFMIIRTFDVGVMVY